MVPNLVESGRSGRNMVANLKKNLVEYDSESGRIMIATDRNLMISDSNLQFGNNIDNGTMMKKSRGN